MLSDAFSMPNGDNGDNATLLLASFDLVLPFTVLAMLFLLIGADRVGPHMLNSLVLPRVLMHSKMLTTIWCIAFVFGHICYNLLALLLWMILRDLFGTTTRPRRSHLHEWCRTFLFLVIIFCHMSDVLAADDPSGHGPPMFKATKSHYTVWFTAWCGWVSMKYPELVDVIQGDEEEPDENDDPDGNTEWWKKNKRIYGALIIAVPTSLKTTLSANARFNGTQALEILQQRFGVVDAGDRASALKRVQKSYISPGASVSVKDVSRQYDRMTEAHAEYTSAGGNAIDDEMLRSYLLSSLPSSYLQIKTVLRSSDIDGQL